MATKKISALNSATALAGTEEIAMVQSAETKKGTPAQLKTYLDAFYQPLDADLTAIAALVTTSYGRALLTLADQAALQAAVSISALGISGAIGDLTPAAATTQSGTAYTAVLGDAWGYILFTNAASITFTIPPNTDVAFPIGTILTIEQNAAGVVTITPGAGVTINSRGTLFDTAGQYAVAQVKKVATDVWTVIGDVA